MSHDAADIIVKVGGSLYDWPLLAERLDEFLQQLGCNVLVVPGGGPFADAVRALDRIHALGEERSHWLALRALSLAGKVLETLRPGIAVIDVHQFMIDDEAKADHLPHSWAATSDSIAARIAVVMRASRLILLKSADPPPNWKNDPAYVDPLFARLIDGAAIHVEAINLRSWRNDLSK